MFFSLLLGTRMSLLRSTTATACALHTLMLNSCPAGWSLAMSDWRNTSGTTWTSTSALLALRTSGAHRDAHIHAQIVVQHDVDILLPHCEFSLTYMWIAVFNLCKGCTIWGKCCVVMAVDTFAIRHCNSLNHILPCNTLASCFHFQGTTVQSLHLVCFFAICTSYYLDTTR